MCDPKQKSKKKKKKIEERQLFWLSKLQIKFRKDNSQPTHKLMAIMFAQRRSEFD